MTETTTTTESVILKTESTTGDYSPSGPSTTTQSTPVDAPELTPVKAIDPIRYKAPRVGRNKPCPCGSEKKFKHCHYGVASFRRSYETSVRDIPVNNRTFSRA